MKKLNKNLNTLLVNQVHLVDSWSVDKISVVITCSDPIVRNTILAILDDSISISNFVVSDNNIIVTDKKGKHIIDAIKRNQANISQEDSEDECGCYGCATMRYACTEGRA